MVREINNCDSYYITIYIQLHSYKKLFKNLQEYIYIPCVYVDTHKGGKIKTTHKVVYYLWICMYVFKILKSRLKK